MNSVQKGDRFEVKVYEFLKREIDEGRFFVRKENCEIFLKKGYYSKDREKDIIFDISIEITIPGQSSYSILVLVECKSYQKKVPVDDVEEFFQKTQQISGGNIKGIVFSTNAFQDGAFKFSKSKGIGLVRLSENNDHDWILTRSPSSLMGAAVCEENNARNFLTIESYRSPVFDFSASFIGTYTSSIQLFFGKFLSFRLDKKTTRFLEAEGNKKSKPFIRKATSSFIQLEAEKARTTLLGSGSFDLSMLSSGIEREYGFALLTRRTLPNGILGCLDFDLKKIEINKLIENVGRRNFTIAHEVGHLVLEHSLYMSRESLYEDLLKSGADTSDLAPEILEIERQANVFAAAFLMPEVQFKKHFKNLCKKYQVVNRGYGALYLDDQICNIKQFNLIAAELGAEYQVSKQAVKYRLMQMKLLKIGFATKRFSRSIFID
ncbi:ImmA/IrrE family metallo-endopeptidase [Oceanospirillum sanctuarii]|uniref:ImmA/IrrE family metallo-endopeptidase n=1 Tax=Oceanospirillum sanctuarii TaxID=1434821 RepID=UPI00159422C0|nr:ImmA/IrrE family metallo-endopeptidase [Oceanospirillum sanctuarii]